MNITVTIDGRSRTRKLIFCCRLIQKATELPTVTNKYKTHGKQAPEHMDAGAVVRHLWFNGTDFRTQGWHIHHNSLGLGQHDNIHCGKQHVALCETGKGNKEC